MINRLGTDAKFGGEVFGGHPAWLVAKPLHAAVGMNLTNLFYGCPCQLCRAIVFMAAIATFPPSFQETVSAIILGGAQK